GQDRWLVERCSGAESRVQLTGDAGRVGTGAAEQVAARLVLRRCPEYVHRVQITAARLCSTTRGHRQELTGLFGQQPGDVDSGELTLLARPAHETGEEIIERARPELAGSHVSTAHRWSSRSLR